MLNISRFSSSTFSAKGSNSTSRRARWSSLAKSALGAVVALGVLTSGRAQALVVNVPGLPYVGHGFGGDDTFAGGLYNVTTFTGSYNDNSSKFATAANGGVIPW